jgi:cyclase
MNFKDSRNTITRREWFQRSGLLLGGAAFAGAFSGALAGRAAAFPFPAFPQGGGNTPDKMRAAMGATPIQAQKLSENLTLLSGPGGNVVVLNGPDGKLMVDTFVLPAWPKLKEHLDGIGKAPLKTVIDTHWHFDHTDNNAHVHEAGATIIAQENTKIRMTQPHDLVPLGLHFDPSPANALPDKTFKLTDKLDFAGEHVSLTHVPPAHTDSDIYVHFQNANVIQSGDVFFNGLYPFIDGGTGGSVHGMIGGATKIIALADGKTKIVPGHGALGDKASLTKYRDMLVVIHDRVQKQKAAGKSLKEVVASKPTKEFDAAWGMGLFTPDTFAEIVYNVL